MSEELFRAVGGVPTTLMGADPSDPANVTWNFGVQPKTDDVDAMIQSTPPLYAALPNVQGKWDGTSTINHWDAAKKVLGESKITDLIQMQPRGTCGGRAGSLTGDLLQLIAIAAGKRAKFHRVSHAAIYYAARKKYNMLHGGWQDERQDGVASGAVPEALASVTGYVQREEDGDTNYYGNGSDDLACKLGAGLLPDVAAKILAAGSDNLVTLWSPVQSSQELADGIAAGGVGIGSDNQGFTMQRDKDGFCRPSGSWSHYQVRASVGVFNGRKGFGYAQSWGRETPSGPLLPGHPGNSFGVDFEVQDRIIRSGDWAVLFSFPLYDLQQDVIDIPWSF